jgi:hypothetical protein
VQCNSWCHEECAGATKSKDLCVEALIKPLKNMRKRTGHINLLKWPKLNFVLDLKFEQNIVLLLSFTVRKSFV